MAPWSAGALQLGLRASAAGRTWLALSIAGLALLAAAPGHAQTFQRVMPVAPERVDSLLRVTAEAMRRHPFDRVQFLDVRGHLARSSGPPLPPGLSLRLAGAEAMSERGQLNEARDTMRVLLLAAPHHPRVLAALGRTLNALGDHASTQRLARTEREAAHDSVLMAPELAEAEERLGHTTEAALVAVQAWTASPLEGEWTASTLARLVPADPRRVRDALQRAVDREPQRADLARALARAEWRAGDASAMVHTLQAADRAGTRATSRWTFAEELLRDSAAHDSAGARAVFLDLAADQSIAPALRTSAGSRLWEVATAGSAGDETALQLSRALADLPGAQWDSALALALARRLREGGHTTEARALLQSGTERAAPADRALEQALNDLRDGPPQRALPELLRVSGGSAEGAFAFGEALFFAGECDSARGVYQRLSDNPAAPHAAAALERLFLIEDATCGSDLKAFARAAYAGWRGAHREAVGLADSLSGRLTRTPLWARTQLLRSEERDALGEFPAAIAPLVALADSLPDDRLASLARQRAGDLYRDRLHDEASAIEQYIACLTRYPKAWNAPEVRRSLERLRKERRS